MNDLEILEMENLSERVYNVFEKYKPLICKKANLYERASKGRIYREDFISNVYEELNYFVSKVDKEKITDISKFSYFISVNYAIMRVFGREKKILDNEIRFPVNEDGELTMQFEDKKIYKRTFDVENLSKKLSERQAAILNYIVSYKQITEISEETQISVKTINREIRAIRKIQQQISC